MTHLDRKARDEVELGISDDAVFAGDHIAFFYETDEEFQRAFGFLDVGLRGADHALVFGIPEDIDRMLAAVRTLGWDTDRLIAAGRLSVLEPADTCEATVERVSRHFEKILATGAPFIRFIGNAAVGRDGWPAEEEFYKLEATVSKATLSLPCVAICMFDLRAQSAQTIMKAAFEGHPVTLHRNCIRENPFYVPRAEAVAG
jgi:DcmR-like sensory protein